MAPDDIVITAHGMVSALGFDVVSSIGSYRAGLVRARELEYFSRIRQDDGESEHGRGHMIPSGTSGFQGEARLLSISRMALQDFIDNNDIAGVEPRSTVFIWSLPDPARTSYSIPKEGEEKLPPPVPKEAPSGGARRKLPAQLGTMLGISIAEEQCYTVNDGHAGVTRAIDVASRGLREGKMKHCIIGGLDSLLDEDTLGWLDRTERLKVEERPVGLLPGEAGVYLLLERFDAASARGAKPLAVVRGSATGTESDHYYTGKPANGRGLSHTVETMLGGSGANAGSWVITDHNGETYRASELGNTIVRLSPKFPLLREARVEYPAISFGDTGSASGAIAVCSVSRAFARGYAPSSSAIILSSSDRSERGALHLAAPSL